MGSNVKGKLKMGIGVYVVQYDTRARTELMVYTDMSLCAVLLSCDCLFLRDLVGDLAPSSPFCAFTASLHAKNCKIDLMTD